MKKLLFVVLVALLLAGCASTGRSLSNLPGEGVQLIFMLVTAAVAAVLLWLGGLLKIDLGGYVQPIVAIIAPILVALIEAQLQLIPPLFDSIVLTVIHLIVLLVGSIGTIVALKKVKAGQTKRLLS